MSTAATSSSGLLELRIATEAGQQSQQRIGEAAGMQSQHSLLCNPTQPTIFGRECESKIRGVRTRGASHFLTSVSLKGIL